MPLFAEVGAPGQAATIRWMVLPLGLTPSFSVADPGQRAQVAALQLVLAHHLALRVHHLFQVNGIFMRRILALLNSRSVCSRSRKMAVPFTVL